MTLQLITTVQFSSLYYHVYGFRDLFQKRYCDMSSFSPGYVNLPVNPSMSRLTFLLKILRHMFTLKYNADGIFTRITAPVPAYNILLENLILVFGIALPL